MKEPKIGWPKFNYIFELWDANVLTCTFYIAWSAERELGMIIVLCRDVINKIFMIYSWVINIKKRDCRVVSKGILPCIKAVPTDFCILNPSL